MNFISIDAVSEKSNTSLFLNNECVFEYDDCKNSSFIPKAINSCLSKTNTDISQLDFIAVTIGPGSYTGIRVAISISQGKHTHCQPSANKYHELYVFTNR